MENIQHLRKILQDMVLGKTEEALEFLDAIEEDKDADVKRIAELEDEVRELDSNRPEDKEYSIDLGLDTIHFSFDKDNMLIKSQVERALNAINKIPHREIQLH